MATTHAVRQNSRVAPSASTSYDVHRGWPGWLPKSRHQRRYAAGAGTFSPIWMTQNPGGCSAASLHKYPSADRRSRW